jgi:hypothetical protein
MTHTEELIARLRDTASRGVSAWGDLQQEAADELETLMNAVAEEREACAKVCEHEWSNAVEREFSEQCAAIIRGRELREQA